MRPALLIIVVLLVAGGVSLVPPPSPASAYHDCQPVRPSTPQCYKNQVDFHCSGLYTRVDINNAVGCAYGVGVSTTPTCGLYGFVNVGCYEELVAENVYPCTDVAVNGTVAAEEQALRGDPLGAAATGTNAAVGTVGCQITG